MFRLPTHNRGFSLVEMVVTIAIFSLVFGGLFASIQYTLKLITNSKATTSALALMNERLEYIRSLSYDAIGTVSGIPSGAIPQNRTSTLNGINFHERVLIQYVDSPDDGEGASDTNGILADYKEVKVEYSWLNNQGSTSTLFLITNITPPGIETTTGGGTLTVNVFDAEVQPVSGAAVRIYNNMATSTVDVTRYTNASGIAMFAGAPAAANYQIFVTKPGYSSDQTYVATTSNPNPSTLPVAVLLSTVTTMNFQIDRLSDLFVRTILPVIYGSFEDLFDDTTHIASQTDTVVVAGDVALSGGVGAYAPTGEVLSTTTVPSVIERWESAEWSVTTPVSTNLIVRIYTVDGLGTYTLVPDSDIPGNSAGFTTGFVDLRNLDITTYPRLALGATLTSSDVNATPLLHAWNILYVESQSSVGDVPFTLTSSKTIGTDAALLPIYKYEESHTTDAGGELQLEDLEWDSYALTLDTGVYDIEEACADIPYVLNPGTDETLTLTLVGNAVHTMRVSVVDALNNPIRGALVEIARPGFSESKETSLCGQTFFNTGLISSNDFQITVNKSGYVSQTLIDLEINGDETLRVILTAS